MSISVTRNDDNSYTVTCGAESVTIGRRGGGGGDNPGTDEPRGGKRRGPIIPTPTEGPVVAAIVASEQGERVALHRPAPLYGPDLPFDTELWLRLEGIGKHATDPAVKVRWEGYGQVRVADLAEQMKKLGLAEGPIEIQGMPPKAER